MSARHRRRGRHEPLAPFVERAPNTSPEFIARLRAAGADDETLAIHCATRVFANGKYTAFVRSFTARDNAPMVHLSVKRDDRAIVDDWRDLQAIKSTLVGPEFDAVQVFPRESALVDTCNQYHLWVYVEPGFELPFGFRERSVRDTNDPLAIDTRQRRFAEPT